MIALGPATKGKGEDVEIEEEGEPSVLHEAASRLVEALGLNPAKLDMEEVSMAFENFVAACCSAEDEGEGYEEEEDT